MNPRNYAQKSRSLGWAWFAVPLSSVVSVLATIVIIQPHSPGATPEIATSAAAGVYSGRTHEVRVMNEPSELDLLRDNATLGDPIAGIALVSQLLDRFERNGRGDDLYEAVQWMDRGWADGHYQSSGLPTRVYERHCGYGALRWHWLCDGGE
ncbi:MAG: hypothetical protein K0Q43_3356 [Ramlibacter sp.]|jgi:hypothetical protein|nr:hypothetical protein [Ramlibacter sp.]